MKFLLALVPVLFSAIETHATALRAVTDPHGMRVESFGGYTGHIRSFVLDDPEVIWMNNLATGIYNSVSISDSLYCYSGSGLNDPRQAVQYGIIDGFILDAMDGNEWEVAASRDGRYWAAINRDVSNVARLYFMDAETGDSLWSYELGTAYPAGTDGLQFSQNGAYLVLFHGIDQFTPPRIVVWDVELMSSQPMFTYDVQEGEGLYARALAVSANGLVIAGTADQYCHIIDLEVGGAREVVNIGASTDGLALSADGNWLVHGFTAVYCRQWDGLNYAVRWQSGLNQRYLAHVLISPDTSYVVSCWYRNTYDENYIRVQEASSGAVLWTYTYARGTDYQDLPSDADISDDGNWFAVGSWGDEGNTNGEVNVFSRWYREPYFQLDMAGSCFTMDLSGDGSYLIAAGKHVHANVFGNGGDVYLADLDLPPAEGVLVVVDTELTADTVCFCADTVEMSPRITNAGHAPFTIDGLFASVVMEDTSYAQADTSLIGTVVVPGDTVALRVWYAPCSVFAGSFVLQVETSIPGAPGNGEIGCAVPYQICTSAEDRFVVQPSAIAVAAYPNPFNNTATIRYVMPASSDVSLRIFDLQGRVAVLREFSAVAAGAHELQWSADEMASGIYFVSLNSQFGSAHTKIVLLK